MQTITKEQLETYLPNPLRYKPERGEEAYRTWTEESRSRTHLAVNIQKGMYFDFHTNTGGSLASLLRQLGAPIWRGTNESWGQYQFQLSIVKTFKSQGRQYRCGQKTAVLAQRDTGTVKMMARVMCLRWNCPRCAPFLKGVWMERLADCHFGAVYAIPKGYKEPGSVLAKIQTRAKRAGGGFERLLLQANDVQLLFVDSRSHPQVVEWLDNEPYFERVAFMPTWEERNRWLEKGLEQMEEPMHWSNKVRCSRRLVDNVNNTHGENITLSTNDSESEYEWVVIDGTLEEHAERLEREGYTLQWLGEHVVKVIPEVCRGRT